jgi:8-amino-7-oxononanoate synthase
MLQKRLQKELKKREELNTLRALPSSEILIDFTSNDYLGFAKHPDLLEKIQKALLLDNKSYGSTGSRLLTGNSEAVESLEKKIASYHSGEASLIYSSGYMANLGLLSCLAQESDTILYDAHIHASIHDASRLSKAQSFPFRHNDVEHLERRLMSATGQVFVVIESIYSMDGTLAPLKTIANICQQYKAHLIVDEAHAVGYYGKKGEGLVSEKNIEDLVIARTYTFGKALGCHGAAIITNSLIKNYLCNFSNAFIYTTALPYSTLCAIDTAYNLLESIQPTLRENIDYLVAFFRSELNNLPFKLSSDHGPIQSITIGDPNLAKKIAKKLKKQGFDVRAIVSPTVRRKSELLRIIIHSFNTKEECKALCNALKNSIKISINE